MTEIETKQYVTKVSMIDAIQITAENMEAVAEWCGGEIEERDFTTRNKTTTVIKLIKVKVTRAMNRRQTEGHIGDYILLRGGDFKVYTEKAFLSSYTDDMNSIPLSVLKEEGTGDLLFQALVDELEYVKDEANKKAERLRGKPSTKPVVISMGPNTATIQMLPQEEALKAAKDSITPRLDKPFSEI